MVFRPFLNMLGRATLDITNIGVEPQKSSPFDGDSGVPNRRLFLLKKRVSRPMKKHNILTQDIVPPCPTFVAALLAKVRSASPILEALNKQHLPLKRTLVSTIDGDGHKEKVKIRLPGIRTAKSKGQSLSAPSNTSGADSNILLQQELADATSRLEDLQNSMQELEQQINEAVQERDQANARVAEVQEYNQTLLLDFTNKHAQDPREIEEPTICKPNELRDLRQAFQMSQRTCADLTAANKTLSEAAEEQKQKESQFREDHNVLQKKCGRLSANFEIWKGRLDNFMNMLPNVVKSKTGMSMEEIPGLKEEVAESASHIDKTREALRAAALEVSERESKIVTLERNQQREVASLRQRVAELQESNIRLDEANYSLESQLSGTKDQLRGHKAELAGTKQSAEQWRAQCEQQAFGEMSQVVRQQFQLEVKQLRSQIEALQRHNTELSVGRQRAESDLTCCRWWAANKMAGIRELGYLRDWYRAQVDALHERFESELSVEPLDIPYKPDFWDLSEEEKTALLQAENQIIEGLTGYDLELAKEPRPRDLEVVDVWSVLVDEYKAGLSGTGQPAKPQFSRGESIFF
ncbi:hypothetical protein AYL99_03539 [Fonsecaea erecta]|uniref:Uncharacterized protein n=1 Tax=Fonsecaea erecta TaxID=1367422 RepID=A0A178ZPN9_9EURO|nr:hypothetical protein AYL99_03539 [Fonsecaea erecta]OAP61336.1 hypothetical protein AYL99_03539 [Fonsecaea erecta]